jgi:formylglycine-generating enzyme
MASVAGEFCIDLHEASVDLIGPAGGILRRHSPYQMAEPGARFAARSRAGVVPQAHFSQKQAQAACQAAGKRLCTDEEWLRACRGKQPTRYPYGDEHVPGRCNDKGVSPLRKLHGKDDSSEVFGFESMNDPRLNQIPGTVAKTGEYRRCRNAFGVHDMVGNLHEWTANPTGVFRGGYYLDNRQHGEGCSYVTTGHDTNYRDYSIGFRCCKGGAGDAIVARQSTKASPAPKTKSRVHVVASGDTLSAIAVKYASSVAAICDANGIRATDPIRPGQELTIPGV